MLNGTRRWLGRFLVWYLSCHLPFIELKHRVGCLGTVRQPALLLTGEETVEFTTGVSTRHIVPMTSQIKGEKQTYAYGRSRLIYPHKPVLICLSQTLMDHFGRSFIRLLTLAQGRRVLFLLRCQINPQMNWSVPLLSNIEIWGIG